MGYKKRNEYGEPLVYGYSEAEWKRMFMRPLHDYIQRHKHEKEMVYLTNLAPWMPLPRYAGEDLRFPSHVEVGSRDYSRLTNLANRLKQLGWLKRGKYGYRGAEVWIVNERWLEGEDNGQTQPASIPEKPQPVAPEPQPEPQTSCTTELMQIQQAMKDIRVSMASLSTTAGTAMDFQDVSLYQLFLIGKACRDADLISRGKVSQTTPEPEHEPEPEEEEEEDPAATEDTAAF